MFAVMELYGVLVDAWKAAGGVGREDIGYWILGIGHGSRRAAGRGRRSY